MKLRLSCRLLGRTALVWLALGSLPCRAQDETDALKALREAVHKDAADQQAERTKDYPNAKGPLQGPDDSLLAQLQSALAPDGQRQLIEPTLSQLQFFYKSDEVAAACARIAAEVFRHKEAQEQALLEQWRAAIARAGQAAKSAKAPEDLDAAVQELTALSPQRQLTSSDAALRAFENVGSATKSLLAWQEYLAERNSGDVQGALLTLSNASNTRDESIMPRSELLSLIEDIKAGHNSTLEERATAIAAGTSTLSDVPASERKLEALLEQAITSYNSSPAQNLISSLLKQLKSVGGYYEDYQAGLPVRVESLCNRDSGGNGADGAAIAALRAQLLRLVVARRLEVDEELLPTSVEPVEGYLQRLLKDALARCDARRITTVRNLQIETGVKSAAMADPQLLQALLAAQSQEEAGQYIPAVVSYEAALKAGGDYVPAKAIGERLDAIKTAHAADFDKGLQLSLAGNSTPGF